MQVLRPSDGSAVVAGPIPVESLGHVRALDGLRAIAVLAVLLYHAEVAGTDGGFLGVSVFFTLSGFLITSLLLREWATTRPADGRRIDLRAFWSRRFRRLLAASWITIAAVLVAGALGVWEDSQLRDLRSDVPWSLADLVNWHFIAQGTSYGSSQSPPSPLQHFWSLAIEEQLYLLLPLLLVVLLGRGANDRRRLRLAAGVLAGLAAASAVANGLLARSSVDRAYFGTDTRAAELLVGALLACAALSRLRLRGRPRQAAVAAGAVGAVALAVLFHVADTASPWLYPWGFLLTSACTVAVVVAGFQRGPVAAALSIAPLVALGRISYGVYLLHWPVFLWLTPARTGLAGLPLLGVRLAVSIVAAAVMYRWVERPIRERRAVSPGQARVAVPAAAVVLLLGSVVVTGSAAGPPAYLQPRDPGDVEVHEAPSSTVPAATAPAPAPPDAGAPATAPPRRPTRVLLVGDSVAASLEDALADALNARGISFATAAAPGCGVITGDPADDQGRPIDFTSKCSASIAALQRDAVARTHPDLVLALSSWEVGDRVVDGRWVRVGTPAGDAELRTLYREMIDRLSAEGARVAILTIPHTVDGRTRTADDRSNERADVVNPLIEDIGATTPGVAALRFDRIVCPSTPCPTEVDGVTLRPVDGGHFDERAGADLVAGRLADEIAALDLDRL